MTQPRNTYTSWAMPDTTPIQTPGAKMVYLIRRKSTTSREELVAHWFANHMPIIINSENERAARGRRHATKYIATLFDADKDGNRAWDGIAQLWWDRALPRQEVAFGTTPTDTFQQKAEPYVGWPTAEYVVMDGSDRLPLVPNTLNPPYPCTRTGFLKITFLVATLPRTDFVALFAHWLAAHVPNVCATMEKVGGFRYVVSHSIEPEAEPYAGIAELYFPDLQAWRRFGELLKPDGMERYIDGARTPVLQSHTEMIGIP